MIQGRTGDEVRRYDNMKLGVLLLLILLLLCMIFNQYQGQPIVTPTVNVPNNGQALTNEDIDLTGTGQADSDLQIVVDSDVLDNDVIYDTKVGNDGQWAYAAQLSDPGDYEVTVKTINESGEALATSEPAPLLVEMATVEIDAPTINLPSGPFFANQAITLDGTASPDYGLQVLLNGEVNGDAEMGANGQWSYNTEISEPGEYEVTVQSIDDNANVLAASDSAFLAVADSTALTLDLPNGGQVNSGEEITLSGTAPAGAEVEVSVDGQVVGTTTASADGTWSFATQIDEAGDHDITVQALDASGNALASADPATLSVDDANLDPDSANPLTLSLPSADEIGAGEEIVLSGRGTPGSDVEILVDGEVVGTTTVGDDGTWSFATQISDPGEHEISVQALDADGAVVDVSDPGSLSIADAAAGAAGALTLNIPDEEAPLSSGRVTLNGTGTPGDEVEVLVDGEAVGRTRVRPDGSWSLATRLNDPGDYEVSVQALDGEGNVTATADPATFSIADAGALTLNLPSATDAVSGEEITLSGEGEPGTEVEIVIDGEVVGTTTVGEDGKWSLSSAISEPGDHDIRAQALDADGNVAVSSDSLALSVVEPGTLTANLPGYGLPLSAGLATFAGLGLPGSDVQVVVDGEVVGTTTVGDDGRWSLDANIDEPGSHEVVVENLDADGNVVSSSDPTTLEIADTQLTVDLPDADALASGEGVTLSGTGEPGSDVQVVADGEVIGTATVDADGKWSLPNAAIDGNSRDIRAQAIDENGRILASSNNPLLSSGTAAAAAADNAADDAADDAGNEGEDTGASSAALTLNLPADEAPLSAGDATFSGEGTPGSEIQVVVDGKVVGKTTVAPDGTWSWTGDLQEPGEHEVAVQEVDGEGEVVSQTDPSTLTIADGSPLTVDLPDGGVALSGEDVTLSGTGTPGSEVQVVVDGEVAGTATVDEDGNWSLPIALSDAGQHDIRIQAVNASGAVQASSNPATLAVAEPGQLMMQVPNGGSLSAGDVTLNGTAEPGAEVQIVLDGEIVGTTTAGDDGKWSFTTPIADPGQYEVSAQVVDAGGDVVASSEAAALNIGDGASAGAGEGASAGTGEGTDEGAGEGTGEGTDAASASLGTLTIPGNISANELTTLSGTGTPGANVQILVDGEVVGTTTVDEEGNWTFESTFDADGDYEVSAQIVDDSDQVVAESQPTSLTVGDAAASAAAPTVELPASASAGDEITLTGTGTPGSQVQIVLNGEVAGTADVADDGTWSFATLIDEAGEYAVSVQSLDGAGEVAAASDGASLSVAEAAAAAGVAPTLTLPASATAGDNVTFTGTGEPGSTLQIIIDGEVVGTTEVDSDGNWSFDTAVLNDAGDIAVSVQSLDGAGEVATASDGASLSVAEAAAAAGVAPTLTLPASATVGENVTFTGTGEPGSTLQIIIDGEVVGTTEVDSDGNWSFDTAVLNDAGDIAVSVQSLDGAGEVAAASDGASLSVAEAAAAAGVAPTLTLPASATAGDNVTFTGTGEPGSTLQIIIDGEVVGTTEVDSDGNWSFDSVLNDAKEYAVSVQSIDGNQQVLAESQAASLTLAAADDADGTDDAGDADDAAGDGQKPTQVTCTTDHIVQRDDWLRNLAITYWDDFTLYPAIVEGTNVKNAEDDSYNFIANPNFIKPGWKLCIVDAETARLLLQ